MKVANAANRIFRQVLDPGKPLDVVLLTDPIDDACNAAKLMASAGPRMVFHRDSLFSDEEFFDAYELSPKLALDRLSLAAMSQRADTSEGLLSPLVVARVVLERLLEARPDQQETHLSALYHLSTPAAILTAGLELFDAYGDERRLENAAIAVCRFGAAALPSLGKLPYERPQELEPFVYPVAYMPGVPRAERLELLADFARLSDESTQRRVLEVLEEFPLDEAAPVLRVLAEAGSDDVRAEAAERLDQ